MSEIETQLLHAQPAGPGQTPHAPPVDAEVAALLAANARRADLGPGEVLFSEGDPGGSLYVLMAGELRVTVRRADGGELELGRIRPGEPVGEVQVLTRGVRTATVRAERGSTLMELPAEALARLAPDQARMLERLVGVVRHRMRRTQLRLGLEPLFGVLDDALLDTVEAGARWVQLRRGDRLFRQGDPGDSLYLLTSGRLRVVLEDGERSRVLGDVARGECVGEMAFFTGEPRTASVYALRDSALVRLDHTLFQQLLAADPARGANVTRLLIERQRRNMQPAAPARVQTVGVIAASAAVDTATFSARLADALSAHGPALLLDGDRVDALLGSPGLSRAAADDPQAPRLLAWLGEQEEQYRFVVYHADAAQTAWTGHAIHQADHLLIVADAAAEPAPGEVERGLLESVHQAVAPRRTLVLLQDVATRLPSGTARWLDARRVDAHLHLRGDGPEQYARLARVLAGRAVGLVLGGGGARGFAHIGVIRALHEAGIPIDLVGGTSMGANIAAECAMGWSADEMLEQNQAWIRLRPHREFTLPLISLVRGRRADEMGRLLFGDVGVEDCWIPYYCISTDITRSEMRVHRRGSLRRAVQASASIPGVTVPVVEGRCLLVDGGIVNNVPADVMRDAGAGVVIAVDVSADGEMEADFESFPSPWALLRGRLLRRPIPPVPGIMEVMIRSAVLGSIDRARITRSAADLYLQPPIAPYGLMEMDRLDEIADVGYRYAREALAAWMPPREEHEALAATAAVSRA
jgi:predicted acylesterase/phospholipase RssA/CRP-like cAMP-binding protein